MWEGRYSEDSFADKPWVVRCKSCDARMAIMPEYGDGNYWWIHGDEGVSHMRDVITESWNTRAERTCRKVPGKMRYGDRKPKCSECGYGLGDPRWTYCPSCGAKVTDLHTAIEDAIGEVIERYPNTMDMLGDE